MELESRLIIRYLQKHPSNAARSLEQFSVEELCLLLEQLPVDVAVSLLSAMPPPLAAQCLSAMQQTAASELIQTMSVHSAVGLLRRMPAEERRAQLSVLPPRSRDRLRRLLRFTENTVGTLMNLDYLHLFRDATVREARAVAPADAESSEIYIVERNQRFAGIADLRKLETSPDHASVDTITRRPAAALSPHTHCAVALNHPCWLQVDEAPVVSREGLLLGVLRHRRLRAWSSHAGPFSQSGLDTALELGGFVWLGLQGFLDTVVFPVSKGGGHD